jgi:hypothetical protein
VDEFSASGNPLTFSLLHFLTHSLCSASSATPDTASLLPGNTPMPTTMMHKTKSERESYLQPPAGISQGDINENAVACMTYQERPRTPEEIRKYRRSANLEPGKRYQHPATMGDMDSLRLEARTFGVTSKSSETTTSALLNQNVGVGTVGKLDYIKAERIYHTTNREPLGKTYKRGNPLPEKYERGK